MSMVRSTLLALVVFAGSAAAFATSDRPYAGMEQRPVKALSDEDIGDLRAGRGMGLALPAELNGLPGPRHVLDLADRLGLSDMQRAAMQRMFDEMREAAVVLGQRVIDREAALDRLFAAAAHDEAAIRALVAEIAASRGELRFTHLRYHLRARDVLTQEQIALYRRERGYDDTAPASPGQRPRQHPH